MRTLFPFQYSHPTLYSINKYSIKLSFEVVCWLATIMLQIPGLRGSYRNPFPKYSVGKRIDALSPGVPPAPPLFSTSFKPSAKWNTWRRAGHLLWRGLFHLMGVLHFFFFSFYIVAVKMATLLTGPIQRWRGNLTEKSQWRKPNWQLVKVVPSALTRR